jgi:FkbM family methyltransferase
MLPQVNIIRAKNGDFLSFYERAGISGVLTAHGIWDEATIHIAKALVDASSKKPVIFDVGANMGTFTIPLSHHILSRNGVLHAFEPQRVIYYQLCGNIFLNRVENAFAHKMALSTAVGEQEIDILNYHSAFNIGAYSLVPGKDNQEKNISKEICIFSTLDNILNDLSISLIKIDVEGMEIDVLSGGIERLAANDYPPIIFESNNGDAKAQLVYELLTKLGYCIIKYAEEDCLAQHPKWDSEIALISNGGRLLISKIR